MQAEAKSKPITLLRSHNNTLNAQWEYGDLLLDYLKQLGVEYVFGIPGGGIEPLYNALARSHAGRGPRAVVARHESGAAFMADGYARESGKLGVCCSTTGPGATNLITGVASAYTDNIPMLVITGQTQLHTFGRGGSQESSCTNVDTVAMFKHCTHYSTLVSHPDQFEYKLLAALTQAYGTNPGPVHISIPLDILRTKVKQRLPVNQLNTLRPALISPDTTIMQELLKLINSAKNAVIVVGREAEEAITEIMAFAALRNFPVVTLPMGKGLISSYHPLYQGVFGLAGHQTAFNALKKESADLIILVGASLNEESSCGWDENTIFTNRLIHIDSNKGHLSHSPLALLRVQGSPKQVFSMLLNEDRFHSEASTKPILPYPNFQVENEEKCYDDSSPIKPQYLFTYLSHICPPNIRALMDIGNSFLWGIHYWLVKNTNDETKNLFRIGLGFASMGWAIGASVGTALAAPNKPVICFTGDGSLLMNGQEITVALQENLNILFVVLNDSALGTVKHGQRLAKAEEHCFELPSINFASIANAMGIVGYRIQSTMDLRNLNIDEIISRPGPCVLDIVIDPNEIPPLGSRMKVLLGNDFS